MLENCALRPIEIYKPFGKRFSKTEAARFVCECFVLVWFFFLLFCCNLPHTRNRYIWMYNDGERTPISIQCGCCCCCCCVVCFRFIYLALERDFFLFVYSLPISRSEHLFTAWNADNCLLLFWMLQVTAYKLQTRSIEHTMAHTHTKTTNSESQRNNNDLFLPDLHYMV